MSIYVGNLSFEATEQDLQVLFQEFGKVTSVAIIKDKFTGRSRGFGFVEMANNAETQAAIAGLNGKEFKGRPLTVNEARPRDDNRNRGQGGARPYGGGGGYDSNRGGFGGNRSYGGGHSGGRDFGGRKKPGGRDSNDRKWNKDRDKKRQNRDWDSGRDY